MFAITLSSRGRPEMCHHMVACAINTARHRDQVLIYINVDNDDPKLQEYRDLQKHFPPTVKMFCDHPTPIPPAKAHNFHAEQAMKDGAQYFMQGADDLYFKTNDWDVLMQPHLKKYPDNIFCMWFNDLVEQPPNHERIAYHPIVHRKWIETIGYISHPDFNYFHPDGWINYISKRLNRQIYVPEIIAQHYNVNSVKGRSSHREADETWLRIRKMYAEKDHEAFRNNMPDMVRDMKKLLDVMNVMQ